MFGFSTNKKAVIVRNDQNDNLSIEEGFQSVPVANHVLAVKIASDGSILLEKEINEFGGAKTTVLEKLPKRKGLWAQIDYEVFPEDELNP